MGHRRRPEITGRQEKHARSGAKHRLCPQRAVLGSVLLGSLLGSFLRSSPAISPSQTRPPTALTGSSLTVCKHRAPSFILVLSSPFSTLQLERSFLKANYATLWLQTLKAFCCPQDKALLFFQPQFHPLSPTCSSYGFSKSGRFSPTSILWVLAEVSLPLEILRWPSSLGAPALDAHPSPHARHRKFLFTYLCPPPDYRC